MNNSITYYKLKSPYEGDVTKNCALSGPEVDNNFFTLEGRDIKSIIVDGTDIVLNLLNGNKIKAKDALDNFIVNVRFDEEKGILTVYKNNGDIEELCGFKSHKCHCDEMCHHPLNVATDETIKGDGTHKKPIGISENYKTGFYKPVNEIIDKPCHFIDKSELIPGDRFITSEKISSYGLLYDYKSVMNIACELKRTNSEWRIPTKEDWDDMLNGVEPIECDRNHSRSIPNKYLGKWAGKILKSEYFWDKSEKCNCNNDIEEIPCEKGKHHPCKPIHCGEFNECDSHHQSNCDGIDKYGFNVVPSGYADDGGNMVFFGKRANFWTSTNIHCENIFVKRFEYDKCNVHQDVIAGQNHLSLRLIKDYNGENYTPMENILGQAYPTVLMPSAQHGKSIWTSVNVYFTDKHCKSLTPNNGQGMSFIKKYFIDEWDGHKWIRNEFKEGYSVVVKNAPNDKINIEYRLTNGTLIDTPTTIYNDVVDSISNDVKKIEDKIDEEIKRALEADNKHTEEIENLKEQDISFALSINNIETNLSNTNNVVANINQVLSDFGDETKKAFETVNNVLTESINNINTAINTESIERVKSDENLQKQIENNKSQIEEVADNLTKEIAERIEKDKEIEGKLLIENGSGFNEDGILVIKSQNGQNDIKIQFTLNMGNF